MPQYSYHLALAHDKSGDEKFAREAVQKALATGQDFPEAADAKKLLGSVGGGK